MSSYSSFDPSEIRRNLQPGEHRSQSVPGRQHPGQHRPQVEQTSQRSSQNRSLPPTDVAAAITPLYQELHLVSRQLRRSNMARKTRVRDESLVSALGRLDQALRRFEADVKWDQLNQMPAVVQRAEQIFLAPADLTLLDRLGVTLDVDPAMRELLKRDFEAAVAEMRPATEQDNALPLDVLHDNIVMLSAEVARAHQIARRVPVGTRLTSEQRSVWRSVIVRVGRVLAVLAVILGAANDSYGLDEIGRTGIVLWRQFVEVSQSLSPEAPG